MKKIFILLLAILPVQALLTAETIAQDKKAETILKTVSEKYKSFKTYKADFVYLLENKKDKLSITKKGSLYVKHGKFKLDMGMQEITCDNYTLWNYNKEANEVQINKYNEKTSEISPAKIFSMYDKGFASQFIEEKFESGKFIQLIELSPLDKKKNYFKIKLYIDKAAGQLIRSKVFDKNGNIFTYEITKFQAHIKIKENFFSFEKKQHPGVEIIDLR